ncbi:unnamed protein product [Leptidea sinapis]|uniref:Uncharacterized protein n=1 Tax=Leptidea sinapis TaxID=189913 RepID=A0A5E4QBP5_9NEOP|nr:unnamed protein product [Leptidea sinapis]
MLPYQAVAMDYVAGFPHHQRPSGLPGVMGLPGPGPGLNPGLNSAFTHSWFVQTSPDICRQQQASNQSHLEPGHVEMTGSSIFDYVHQADHGEIAEQLGLSLTGRGGPGLNSPASGSEEGSQHGTNNPDVSAQMTLAASGSLFRGMDRAFCVRMKSTLTKRGCHFKSSGYRVVLMLCRLRPQYTFSHSRKTPPSLLGMVALAIALPPPSVHEIRLESDINK